MMGPKKFNSSTFLGEHEIVISSDSPAVVDWAALQLRKAAEAEENGPRTILLTFEPVLPVPLTPEEAAEMAKMEQLQRDCPMDHVNIDPEEGCPNCGYYAK